MLHQRLDLYQRNRRDARKKISQERKPYWLQTYAHIIDEQQEHPLLRELFASLKPWEREENKPRELRKENDPRWTAFREHPRNQLALSIRSHVTKCAWFEVFILAFIVAVGAVVGMELHDADAYASSSKIVDIIALIVFTLEAVLKVLAEGERPIVYFTDANDGAFNTFDFVIVVLSFAFLGKARVNQPRLARDRHGPSSPFTLHACTRQTNQNYDTVLLPRRCHYTRQTNPSRNKGRRARVRCSACG